MDSRTTHSPHLILLALMLCPILAGGACEQNAPPRIAPDPVQVHSTKARPAPIVPVESDPTPKDEAFAWPPELQPLEMDNPNALDAFYSRLRRIEAGEPSLKARAIHYGDSHIAADLWTGQIRRRLQSRFGDAGHGFILPGKPWRSYRHQNIRHGSPKPKLWNAERIRTRANLPDRRLGLGGYSVRTSKRGANIWAATTDKGDFGRNFSQLEVFYLEQPKGGRMEVRVDGKRIKRVETKGPAIIPGYFTYAFQDGEHSVEVETRGGGEVRLFGMVLEREGAGVVYDSVGINGARATMPLSWNPEVWQQHLGHRSPDLMILTYGTNEVDDQLDLDRYQDKIVKVLRLMKDAVPGSSCLLMGPPDRAWPVAKEEAQSEAATAARMRAEEDPRDRSLWDTPAQLLDIIETQKKAAKTAGCAFWNTYEAMGGAGSIDLWARSEPTLAQKDRIHLNRRGYNKVADQFADALLFDYEKRFKPKHEPLDK